MKHNNSVAKMATLFIFIASIASASGLYNKLQQENKILKEQISVLETEGDKCSKRLLLGTLQKASFEIYN
jgi:hypothetical protein